MGEVLWRFEIQLRIGLGGDAQTPPHLDLVTDGGYCFVLKQRFGNVPIGNHAKAAGFVRDCEADVCAVARYVCLARNRADNAHAGKVHDGGYL